MTGDIFDSKPRVIVYEKGANNEALDEICAGLEEEGMLYAVVKKNMGNANELAFSAASHSKLNVGIGITKDCAVLTMGKGKNNKPMVTADVDDYAECRKLGTNGARAVKGGVFV